MVLLMVTLMAVLIAGCGLMSTAGQSSVVFTERNPPEFMEALAAGTLTEQELVNYKVTGTVAAVVYDQSMVMIAGTPVRSNTWMISCHRDERIRTFVTFVGGRFSSSSEFNAR